MRVGAENNETLGLLKQIQCLVVGPQWAEGEDGCREDGWREDGWTGPGLWVRGAPSQAHRSPSAFFQAIIFEVTRDFDQPIKLL